MEICLWQGLPRLIDFFCFPKLSNIGWIIYGGKIIILRMLTDVFPVSFQGCRRCNPDGKIKIGPVLLRGRKSDGSTRVGGELRKSESPTWCWGSNWLLNLHRMTVPCWHWFGSLVRGRRADKYGSGRNYCIFPDWKYRADWTTLPLSRRPLIYLFTSTGTYLFQYSHSETLGN